MVGGALIEAMRSFAGEQWGVEYDQAWADAYAVIAAKMLAGAEADTNPPYWYAEVVAHERRGQRHRGLHRAADAAAGVPRRAVPERGVPAVPAAAVAHLLAGERAAPGQHARVPRAGGRRRLGVQRAGPPAPGRRHDPAGRADGLDEPGPALHPGRGVRRRRHRPGPDQVAAGGADPVQPDPLGARLLRRPQPRRPVRPGRAEPAGRPLPVAVGGDRVQRRPDVRRASRATSPTWWPATARGTSTTSSSPAPARWSRRP